MQVSGNILPGYRVYEYLLVMTPHEELRNRILQVRKSFSEEYKSAQAMASRPHLTLVNFMQYAMMEERLVNRLRVVAMGQTPFRVELQHFGSFPAHTIYIQVGTRSPVLSLVKDIRQEAQRLMKLNDETKPHFITEPHITIARKLQPWQYEKGWLDYSTRHFTGRFMADGMTLLRRPAGEFKYQVIQQFHFQNMPVMTRQGELFG